MKAFFEQTVIKKHHPLHILETFLERERANELAQQYSMLRFVGYVLEIGYETVTIITSDPFKVAVGGIPRNSLLIMVPAQLDGLPLHFTLLRVLESAPTPLAKEVQQTYFELQKKSMPELDIFTQSELQWGALKTGVLGMFYPHPEQEGAVEFSGDLNNFVSAHRYRVYAPDDELHYLVVNATVPPTGCTCIGSLRLTECRLPLADKPLPCVFVYISMEDFKGTRTAMFGKTRMGKSNVVKLLAQSLIETTTQDKSVGQLIFDVDGEYANDNPQHHGYSLKSAYPNQCTVYAITPKPKTPSKPLKLNFYEHPADSHRIISSLLKEDGRASGYIQSFTSIEIPSLEEVKKLSSGSNFTRSVRKLQMYWAILKQANYAVYERHLLANAPYGKYAGKFNPGFSGELREAAYKYADPHLQEIPQPPQTLEALLRELRIINRYRKADPKNNPLFQTETDHPLFDADDTALLEFLDPSPGRSGTILLQRYRQYHDACASNCVSEILALLDIGQTVILDLGNANPEVMDYFSSLLSKAILRHQVDKFTSNRLQNAIGANHFIQLYFEEAHNLFPYQEDPTSIYHRLAKEGGKYHIGIVYSTQSPTTLSRDLLGQTENFFVAHLSSQDEVNALAKLNTAFEGFKDDILRAKTPGYLRMLTRSHRFVISMQAREFLPPQLLQQGNHHAL